MDPKELMTANKVVGTKETLRMVEKHLCKIVFINRAPADRGLRKKRHSGGIR